MSNGRPIRRRLSAAQTALANEMARLDGKRVPGGCDDCDAYQTVAPARAGAWLVRVHHDDWCPTLARLR